MENTQRKKEGNIMNSSDKKRFTTKVQFTEKQQKAAEARSIGKKRLTMEEIEAKEKAKKIVDSLQK